jgi:hypothetical protein
VHASKVTRQLARGDGEQGCCRIQIPTTSESPFRCDGPAVSYAWIGFLFDGSYFRCCRGKVSQLPSPNALSTIRGSMMAFNSAWRCHGV